MAPDAENPPALAAEKFANCPVSFLIACDFEAPVAAISAGHAAVPSAAVPETAVHEDGKAGATEGEIGAAGEGLVPPPAGDASGAKDSGEL